MVWKLLGKMSRNANKLLTNGHKDTYIDIFAFLISLTLTITGEITPLTIFECQSYRYKYTMNSISQFGCVHVVRNTYKLYHHCLVPVFSIIITWLPFYSILSHNLGRSSGHHRWICNNPFPSWPVFSCPSWAGKVHSCPLFDIVFPPLLLSAYFSFSFHCAL